MLLWQSPSIHKYDEALAIVRAERDKPLEKDGPPPPWQMTDSRYVEAWHFSEKQILESSEQWLFDMYTCHRWKQWVENDEFERMRGEGGKKKDRAITDDEAAQIRANNPKYAQLPNDVLKKMFRRRR